MVILTVLERMIQLSNRLFQGVIHQMKDVVGRTIGVLDETGAVISCSDLARIGETVDTRAGEASPTNAGTVWNGYTYVPFGSSIQPEYTVFVEGTDAKRLA